MEPNVGGNDSVARFIGGVVLLALGILGYVGYATLAVGPIPQAAGSAIVALAGVVLLATALTSRCAVNKLLGRDTTL